MAEAAGICLGTGVDCLKTVDSGSSFFEGRKLFGSVGVAKWSARGGSGRRRCIAADGVSCRRSIRLDIFADAHSGSHRGTLAGPGHWDAGRSAYASLQHSADRHAAPVPQFAGHVA